MKFLIDAQLPFKLKIWILARGVDAVHTDDLPDGSLTSDLELVQIARVEDRVLITKDSDFLRMKVLSDEPPKLVLVATGNINNPALFSLFETNFDSIVRLLDTFEVVKL